MLGVRDSPKLPPERITLTRPVINSSVRVWMVIAGAEKASALGLVLAGASYSSVPAAGAKGRKRTVIFVDEAAASEVPTGPHRPGLLSAAKGASDRSGLGVAACARLEAAALAQLVSASSRSVSASSSVRRSFTYARCVL